MLQHLWNDVRYAARRLGAGPGFTAAAVLTIALGVGVNTGIFSVLNGLTLRELPMPDADQLVNIHQIVEGDESRRSEGSSSAFSTSEYRIYRDRAQTVTDILGYSAQQWSVSLGEEPSRRLSATFVTCNYFEVLRRPPVLGSGFTGQHCEPGAAPTIVLGHDVWSRAFGADPDIIGRDVVVNRRSFTVVGVAPQGMRGVGMMPVSAFLPIATQPMVTQSLDIYGDERTAWLALIGRRDGASVDQVRAELGVIATGIDRQRPPRETTLVVDRARPFSEPWLRPVLFAVGGVVMAAFGLVLLIACANVANLMLARASGRSREIAVRLSLGASRARIVQQLLTESMLLATAGGLLGSALAIASSQALFAFALSTLPVPELLIDASPDARVLAFSLALSLGTGIVCGLAPALHVSKPGLHNAMKQDAIEGSRGTGSRLRGTLVGIQVAVSMVLMIAAGLLLRGLNAAQNVEPGFAFENVSTASISLTEDYSDAERRAAFHLQFMERVRSQPGIDAVAQAAVLPLSASLRGSNVRLPGRDDPVFARVTSVSPGYFSLLDIPIVRGRTFTEAELTEGSTAVIVTEATARRFWPGQDPIGQTIITPRADYVTGGALGERNLEVVGVARDAQVTAIGQIPATFLYLPAIPQNEPVLYLLARSRVDSAATAAAIRAAAAELDPAVSVSVEPLEANFDLWRDLSRLVSTLSTSLGVLSLVLAAVGIYGVVAYAVARRIREIGIRIALGASAYSVVSLILTRTMRPVVIGAVVGLAAAAGISRVLSSVLFGVSPADPVALVGAALVVAGVSIAAGILPARRAAQIDPMRTLQYE